MSDTIFHKIMRKEIPSEIIFEDDKVIAIKDINKMAPEHYLVIPKKDMPSLREAKEEDKELLGHMMLVVSKLARDNGFSDSGYRVVINVGEDGGQEVMQLHIHVLGKRDMSWPPG